MRNEKWRMVNGEWRVENKQWRMMNGEWEKEIRNE